jgi:hypothetical protein
VAETRWIDLLDPSREELEKTAPGIDERMMTAEDLSFPTDFLSGFSIHDP